MKAAYIEPFIKAANDVFRLMMDITTERGELRISEELIPSKDASVIIGVTGDLYGSILYSFPKEMTLQMVEIMANMKMTEIDSFVISALGEVANIISGNAITHLSASSYRCDIVPPQVVIGQNTSLSMATNKALIIPFTTPIGDFDIYVTLRER